MSAKMDGIVRSHSVSLFRAFVSFIINLSYAIQAAKLIVYNQQQEPFFKKKIVR